MKKNRYIPFGYKMQNGESIPHEQEAPVVKEIFSRYMLGESYQIIAKSLTACDVPYHAGKPKWDKSMIKRILGNRKYIGDGGYPALVDRADFERVAAIQDAKNHYGSTAPYIASIRKKAVCTGCGDSFRRDHGVWVCKNAECNSSQISNKILLDSITRALDALISNPNLAEPDVIPDNRKSLEAIRLQNEVNRELDKPKPDAERVKSLLYACAAQKYADCAGIPPPHLTTQIKAALAVRKPLQSFGIELFDSIVKQVHIAPDGTARLRLINEKSV